MSYTRVSGENPSDSTRNVNATPARHQEANGLRRCCQCGQIKPLATDFGNTCNGRSSKTYRCVTCLRENLRVRRLAESPPLLAP